MLNGWKLPMNGIQNTSVPAEFNFHGDDYLFIKPSPYIYFFL